MSDKCPAPLVERSRRHDLDLTLTSNTLPRRWGMLGAPLPRSLQTQLLCKQLGLCQTMFISHGKLLAHGRDAGHRYVLLGLHRILFFNLRSFYYLKTGRFCIKTLISQLLLTNQKIWQDWQGEGRGSSTAHSASHACPLPLSTWFPSGPHLLRLWAHVHWWPTARTVWQSREEQPSFMKCLQWARHPSELFSDTNSFNPHTTPWRVSYQYPQVAQRETDAREVQWFARGHTTISGRNPRKTKENSAWNPDARLLIYPAFKMGQTCCLSRTFPILWSFLCLMTWFSFSLTSFHHRYMHIAHTGP